MEVEVLDFFFDLSFGNIFNMVLVNFVAVIFFVVRMKKIKKKNWNFSYAKGLVLSVRDASETKISSEQTNGYIT